MSGYLSVHNKHLIVRTDVRLNDLIDTVIHELDPFFSGRLAYVTSGLRTKEHQLQIIRHYALLKGVAKEFPSILTATIEAKTFYHDKAVYAWQPAWSRLLEMGVIINPPVAAAPLFDYWRSGKNLKGITIMPSPHLRGTAFDIGGGGNGVEDEREILAHAMPEVAGIRSIVVERENNCLHVNCQTI